MVLITKARSLRPSDKSVFKDICSQLPSDPRELFRDEIYQKLEFATEKEIKIATTSILQKLWEGNHLLEYFKFIVKKVSEEELESILYQYGFAQKQNEFVKFEDFKNQFSSGFGETKTKKLFFVLATAQQLSVLKCLVQFLEFCLEENRPLQYFYADKASFTRYVEAANNILKTNKNKTKNKFDLSSLRLLEEDRLRLEKYIGNANDYLNDNSEKGLPEADFEATLNIEDTPSKNPSKNSSKSSSAYQSLQPRLTEPKAREGNKNYYANAALEVIGRKKQKDRLKEFLDCDLNVAWFQLAGEAGQGKSRLAFDLMNEAPKLGYRAGFLRENDIKFFKNHWDDWQPDNNYLLIFDYVIGREHEIKPILQSLIYNYDNFEHKIRILLLERQRWDKGTVINKQVKNDNEEIRTSANFGTDKAEWFLNLCERDDHDGEFLKPYCFDGGVEELGKLDVSNLVAIVKQLFSGEKLTISDGDLEETLKRIDDSGRPLYAYLLAQELSDSLENFHNWTQTDLLTSQLKRDKIRWREAFDGEAPTWGDDHPAMKLAVLSTIVHEVKFQDDKIEQYFGNINSLLIKEAVAITSGHLISNDNCPDEIHALEPDLLGEWFVLYCFDKRRLKFEELLDFAWEYWPNETATFLQKISRDFIVLPKEFNNCDLTEKLLAYQPPHENHYHALGNVAASIVEKLDQKKLTIPENIISALEYAANASDPYAMACFAYFISIGYEGIGVKRTIEMAMTLAQRAIELGNSSAMTLLGLYYLNNGNWFTGMGLLTRAKKLGNSRAMVHLALSYKEGEDWIRPIDLLKQAVELGDGLAMFHLALRYQKGEGVKQDWKQAIELYERSVEEGQGAAMINLGLCYEKGTGVERDWEQAINLYKRGIQVGDDRGIDKLHNILLLQNFLGEGSYKTRGMRGWSNNKNTHLTEAPVFDPPIMVGNWQQLSVEEVTACLDKVVTQFEILGLAEKLDGYLVQYARRSPLSFYKNCNLMDVQLYNPSNENTLIFSAIVSPESAILLNGKENFIYNLGPYLLTFDDESNTLDYLKFCCSYTHFENKPIQIISNLNEIPFDEGISQDARNRLKEFLRINGLFFSPQYIGGDFGREGWQQFEVCILDGNVWGVGTFRIFFDGGASTVDTCHVLELPILQRQYDGVFRTPLRSSNH